MLRWYNQAMANKISRVTLSLTRSTELLIWIIIAHSIVSEISYANYQHVLRYSGIKDYFDTEKHHLPHIHIRYNEFKASIAIPSGDVLEGSLACEANEICPGVDRIASG